MEPRRTLWGRRSNEALLSKMGGAVLRGLTLAAAGRGRMRLLLALHAETGAPLPRATLRALGLQLALLAGIRAAFRRHWPALASALPHLLTHFKSALAVRPCDALGLNRTHPLHASREKAAQ
jgi:hypothetical protein